jgi:U3 small nucleolar RNA-associated protein 25
VADARFDFFTKKILPRYSDEIMAQTLVFVSSYFDFVRLRNFFKKQETSFVELCEYTPEKSISRSRTKFFDGNAHFMLFTERFHFYRRYRLRGIRHLIFYDLPRYPHFYYEICNMLQDLKRHERRTDDCQCSILYTKLDGFQLTGVVGSVRAAQMCQSDTDTHLFVTGD